MIRKRGMGLLELLLAVGLLGIIFMLAGSFLARGIHLWKALWSADAAEYQLRKAVRLLERDLGGGDALQVSTKRVPSHLSGVASDGLAIWFLSTDDGSGVGARTDVGEPRWQRNVLYYLVVPQNHDALARMSCTGGTTTAAGNFDAQCPHKLLVRKVIDFGDPTDWTDATEEEELMGSSDVDAYLTQPDGLDVGAMTSEPNVEQVQVVAANLLWWNVELAPNPAHWPREVAIDMRAVILDRARQEVRLGQEVLFDHVVTRERKVSIQAMNTGT